MKQIFLISLACLLSVSSLVAVSQLGPLLAHMVYKRGKKLEKRKIEYEARLEEYEHKDAAIREREIRDATLDAINSLRDRGWVDVRVLRVLEPDIECCFTNVHRITHLSSKDVFSKLIRANRFDIILDFAQEGVFDFEENDISLHLSFTRSDEAIQMLIDLEDSYLLNRNLTWCNETPLVYAALWGSSMQEVEGLLKAGADPCIAYVTSSINGLADPESRFDILFLIADQLKSVKNEREFERPFDLMQLFLRYGSSLENSIKRYDKALTAREAITRSLAQSPYLKSSPDARERINSILKGSPLVKSAGKR